MTSTRRAPVSVRRPHTACGTAAWDQPGPPARRPPSVWPPAPSAVPLSVSGVPRSHQGSRASEPGGSFPEWVAAVYLDPRLSSSSLCLAWKEKSCFPLERPSWGLERRIRCGQRGFHVGERQAEGAGLEAARLIGSSQGNFFSKCSCPGSLCLGLLRAAGRPGGGRPASGNS